MTTAAVY